MEESTLGALIIILTAVLPCSILGYLIAFRQRRNLISGWSDSKVSNPEACAKIIGIGLIIMSLALTIISYFWWAKLLSEYELLYYLTPTILLPLVGVTYTKVKYGVK